MRVAIVTFILSSLLAVLPAAPAGAVTQVLRLSNGFDFVGVLGYPSSVAGFGVASGNITSASSSRLSRGRIDLPPQPRHPGVWLAVPVGDHLRRRLRPRERRGWPSARRSENRSTSRVYPHRAVALSAGFNSSLPRRLRLRRHEDRPPA
jgi:hypothetical protein